MADLAKTLNLQHELPSGIDQSNFEQVYSNLYEKQNAREHLSRVEQRVFDYFASMQISSRASVYDFLIFGLREKDLIATFNWDPLLAQTYARCKSFVPKLPQIVFLHGNTAIGYCGEDDSVGTRGSRCRKCNSIFSDVPLLYPIQEKNYEQNEFIARQWMILRNHLQDAARVTIFGYSAPTSDEAAIGLFRDAWGDSCQRTLHDIEFITMESDASVSNSWQFLITNPRYSLTTCFFESSIAMWPRRTCEAWADESFDMIDRESIGISSDTNIDEFLIKLQPLIEEEYE